MFRDMLSKIPAAARKIISDVPPALTNGSVCPVGGMELVATAMLMAACMPMTAVMPAAIRLPKRSLQRMAMRTPR